MYLIFAVVCHQGMSTVGHFDCDNCFNNTLFGGTNHWFPFTSFWSRILNWTLAISGKTGHTKSSLGRLLSLIFLQQVWVWAGGEYSNYLARWGLRVSHKPASSSECKPSIIQIVLLYNRFSSSLTADIFLSRKLHLRKSKALNENVIYLSINELSCLIRMSSIVNLR